MKTALVTGGSSGIGRNVPQDGIKHISVDVTDENAVQKAVALLLWQSISTTINRKKNT